MSEEVIVSIHQPQFLPWLNYFLKIEKSDLFIFLDTVDFQKNGVQNRNQIKTPQGGQWLTIPVHQKLGQKINEVETNSKVKWRKKTWNSIRVNYTKAPFFNQYAPALEEIFEKPWEKLADLNFALTQKLLAWLEISTEVRKSVEMGADGTGSDLILNLCKEVGAQDYLSGVGGRNYLKLEDFEREKIRVEFLPPQPIREYPQCFPKVGFVSDLSALDILFNCGKSWREYV